MSLGHLSGYPITTDTGKELQVYVSRTGRSIRVYKNHKEMTP